MATGPSTVVLVSAPEALPGLDEAFRRRKVRLVRIPVLEFAPRPASLLKSALQGFGAFDTLVLTSSEAVATFVRPLAPVVRSQGSRMEVWAGGPSTARELRALGFRRIYRAPGLGSIPLLDALRRARPRSVVYPRSDRAGPNVAHTLRTRGDRVLDLVSYSVRPRTKLTLRERNALSHASAWIVTSPSAISALREALGSSGLRSLSRATRVLVLGERTRRAAWGHGIRGARSIGTVTTEGITYYVARWLAHAADAR